MRGSHISITRLLSREGLLAIKKRALRRGVWYKILTGMERGFVDLTIKCVERIRSPVLARIITKIICKLLKALKSEFLVKVEHIGRERAEKICLHAVKWGNREASSWKYDVKFIRFLGMNAIYDTTLR